MRKLFLAVALMLAAPVYAQVDVVESAPIGPVSATTSPPATTGSNQAELYYQLQVLQQEVLELRGKMEEQAFELKRLKQQRLDDYLDLDRRLSALGGGGSANNTRASGTKAISPRVNSAVQLGNAAQSGDRGRQAYRNAIDLVLKQKNYDQAINEFNAYLSNFPQGRYAANAHYWLGEIHLLKSELEQARQWFTKLLDGFPNHRKVPDTKFKLGKVYYQLGDKSKAKELLQKAADSGTDAARLARNFLQENF